MTPACDGRVVEERQRVARAEVRVGVQPERLVDHVDVVDAHGVVDGLQDRGVAAEHEADQARAGSDADDPDVAARRQRVGLVDELREVVDDDALRSDGRRVAERLPAVGGRARAGAGEVLVVDEHVLAVGADEVGVVRVHAVGDERHGDAVAVRQLLGIRAAVGREGPDRLQRLGLDQRVRGIARADLVVADRARRGRLAGSLGRAGGRCRSRRLGDRHLTVGDHRGDGRVGSQGGGLVTRHRCRERVAECEVLDVWSARRRPDGPVRRPVR